MEYKMNRIAEMIRFCIVGGVSFFCDWSLLYFFTEYLRWTYLYSSGISFCIAVVINYWLCIAFVFYDAEASSHKQQMFFFFFSFIGLIINQVCMWVFVEFAAINYMIAKIFATIIVTLWNYIMKRKAVMLA